MNTTIAALQQFYVSLGGNFSDVENITTIPEMLNKIQRLMQIPAGEKMTTKLYAMFDPLDSIGVGHSTSAVIDDDAEEIYNNLVSAGNQTAPAYKIGALEDEDVFMYVMPYDANVMGREVISYGIAISSRQDGYPAFALKLYIKDNDGFEGSLIVKRIA